VVYLNRMNMGTQKKI